MRLVFLLALAICSVISARAQTSSSSSSQSALPQRSASSHASSEHAESGQKLWVTVTDENGVAVGLARVELQPPSPALPLHCETDFAGRCEFTNLSIGTYELRVEKIGFYAISQSDVQVGVIANVEVTLSHLQEAREVVNVRSPHRPSTRRKFPPKRSSPALRSSIFPTPVRTTTAMR